MVVELLNIQTNNSRCSKIMKKKEFGQTKNLPCNFSGYSSRELNGQNSYNFINSIESISGKYNYEELLFLDELKQQYQISFNDIVSRYDDPESFQLGTEVIKLTNEFYKEIVRYAQSKKIDYIYILAVCQRRKCRRQLSLLMICIKL